jgi:hypothetical protein
VLAIRVFGFRGHWLKIRCQSFASSKSKVRTIVRSDTPAKSSV